MTLTTEQIDYAYKFTEIRIKQRYGRTITDEDIQDLQSYCIRKLIRKWRLYDERKTTWKTYMVVILNSSLTDAYKWHYRQRQRLSTEPIGDNDDFPCPDNDVEAVIDELFGYDELTNRIMHLRWHGYSQKEICRECKITQERYTEVMDEAHDHARSHMPHRGGET